MDFTYPYETELRNLLQLVKVGKGKGLRGTDDGGNMNNAQ
jgi:hypothetical protein